MTFSDACVESLLRAIVAGLLVLPISRWQSDFLNQRRGKLVFALFLLPFFVPELLIGYAYSSFTLAPAFFWDWARQFTLFNDVVYVVLMAFKVAPAAALARQFAPDPVISNEALHCHRLLKDSTIGQLQWYSQHILMCCRARLWRAVVPFAIGFLLVFQEFETASLLGISTWTVHLFDAQFQGLQLVATLKRVVFPIVIELLVIVPIVVCLAKRRPGTTLAQERITRASARCGLASLLISMLLLAVLPCIAIGQSGFSGLSLFLRNSVMVNSMAKEILTAFMMASVAAIGAWVLSSFLLRRATGQQSGKTWKAVTFVLCLPGLAGSLAISLQVLTVVQLPGISVLRSTPIPSLIAFVLFLLPRAILLLVAFQMFKDNQASNVLGRMVASSPAPKSRSAVANLAWRAFGQPVFLVVVILFYWCFTNLTVSSILNPPTIVPLPVRLYNLMHYGQTGPLSVMAMLSFLAPLTLIATLAILLPRIVRRRYM